METPKPLKNPHPSQPPAAGNPLPRYLPELTEEEAEELRDLENLSMTDPAKANALALQAQIRMSEALLDIADTLAEWAAEWKNKQR